MTKNEAKNAALRWLDEASEGGCALEQETTADWMERMDHLLDGAVAAVCGRFPHRAVHMVSGEPQTSAAWRQVQLPENCDTVEQIWQLSTDGRPRSFSDYRRIERRCYAVPADAGALAFHYIRRPRAVGPTVPETTVLDVLPEAESLVPLRLAADLLVGADETAALSAWLEQRYAAQAAVLFRRPAPDRATVECIYTM